MLKLNYKLINFKKYSASGSNLKLITKPAFLLLLTEPENKCIQDDKLMPHKV